MASKKMPDKLAAKIHRKRLGLPEDPAENQHYLADKRSLQFSTIIDCIQTGSYLETAFMVAGISKQRAYQWFKMGNEGQEPYASFLVDVRKAQGEAIMKNLQAIDLAAARGDWKAAAWRLEKMYPSMYGARLQLTDDREDFSITEAPVEATSGVDVTKLSLEEKKTLRALMVKATDPGVIDV